MTIFANAGFMGYPVVQAIFGDGAIYYAALFNMVFYIYLYSAGIMMISGKPGETLSQSGGIFQRLNFKLLINASLITSLIAVVIVFSGFRAPSIITDTVKLASGMNTPCAMLAIGGTLARISFKDVFTNWRLYPVTLLKNILIPVVIWLVFRQFISNGLYLGVLTVLSGMPIAAAVSMIAIEYNGDERTASSGIFLTTLLSALTIPLIAYLLL
jgi:predicted permease